MQHFEYLFLQRSQCRSSFSKYSRSSGALRGIPEGPFVLGIASVALVCMFSARQTSSKSASKLKTHPRCNIRLASGKPCMGKGPHAEHDRHRRLSAWPTEKRQSVGCTPTRGVPIHARPLSDGAIHVGRGYKSLRRSQWADPLSVRRWPHKKALAKLSCEKGAEVPL